VRVDESSEAVRNASVSDRVLRDELVNMLSVCSNLAGLCVTVVACMNSLARQFATASVVDDVFAVCALLFLVSTSLIFAALRSRRPALARRLVKLIDALVLAGLAGMTMSAFVLVYAVW